MRRDYVTEMGFSCPTEQSEKPGRPRFQTPEEVIRGLYDIHGVLKEVAKEAGVSCKSFANHKT